MAPSLWEVHHLGLVQEQQPGGDALGQDRVQRCQVCHKQECDLAHKGNCAVTMGLQQVKDAGELQELLSQQMMGESKPPHYLGHLLQKERFIFCYGVGSATNIFR